MANRLQKLTGDEFESGVKRLSDLLFSGCVGVDAFAECQKYSDPDECYMRLLDTLNRARHARLWFAEYGPRWGQPLPIFYYDEQEKIMCGSNFPQHLVCYYSQSLQKLNFNFLKHPPFFDYARGVMAHPDCPSYLQDDPGLLRQFPPRPLPGLDGTDWRPPRSLSAL